MVIKGKKLEDKGKKVNKNIRMVVVDGMLLVLSMFGLVFDMMGRFVCFNYVWFYVLYYYWNVVFNIIR